MFRRVERNLPLSVKNQLEESTNMLLEHVVLMDLHQKENEEKASQKSERSLYLMDIAEDPLIPKCTVSLPEEEEEFMYKGEIGSSDEAEDEDEQSATEHGTLPSLTDVISSPIISEETASALQVNTCSVYS